MALAAAAVLAVALASSHVLPVASAQATGAPTQGHGCAYAGPHSSVKTVRGRGLCSMAWTFLTFGTQGCY